MTLARVIGSLQATTVCHGCDGLRGVKLLWVRPQSSARTPSGDPFVACDATGQAGPGDLVYLVDGREAAMAFENDDIPADYSIVGIVDAVEVER